MSRLMQNVSAADVTSPETFAAYAHQALGTKYPNQKELAGLRKRVKEFFDYYPLADWGTVVTTVAYIRARHKRLAMPWGVFSFVPGR
jgi:hypothetical protein